VKEGGSLKISLLVDFASNTQTPSKMKNLHLTLLNALLPVSMRNQTYA
jgi:hypothetical protein